FVGARLLRYAYSFQTTPRTFLASVRDSGFRDRDIVHVFTGANTAIGLLYIVLGRLTGKKTGVSVFGKDFLASRPSRLFFVPLLLSLTLANHVMVNSLSTLRRLPPAFRKKAKVLYPGIDPEELGTVQPRASDTDRRKVLFVGRLVRRKGLPELLRAFEIVSKSCPDARLAIVGDGPYRQELERLVAESPVRDRVELKGMLTGKPLFQEYASCDVFVMPSRATSVDTEGFGMVFLEAAFFSRPAVGTRSGGIPEAVVDGETGLLVEQDDVSGLAQKIVTLLSDKALSQKLGQRARERVLSDYTWRKATRRFLDMYGIGEPQGATELDRLGLRT
ncbi:MAG TPA: glycosyltransferase family 4 protein, partial [Nitrososphaerales archaeon]|nr:glycosyltransferase family 4 protein [Nitrososphaerales archaeon]